MKNILKQIQYGFLYPFLSIKILFSNKVLWKYIIYTWLIAFLFLFLFYVAYLVVGCLYVVSLAKYLDPHIPSAMKEALVQFLVNIGREESLVRSKILEETLHFLFLVSAILSALIVQAIANKPWNNKISKQVERFLTGRVIQNKPLPFWQGFKDRMRERFFYFFASLLLIPAFFVPYLREAAIFLYPSFFAGKAYCEYVLDRRQLSYKLKKKKVKKNFFLILTLGSVCLLFLMIPVLNIIFISLNVIAGTMAVVEKIDPRSLDSNRKNILEKSKSTKNLNLR